MTITTSPNAAPLGTTRARRSIPQVPGLPLIGNMVDLFHDPGAFFVKGYSTVGPVFHVRAPTRQYYVMAGMEANRFLMREDAQLFDNVPLYQAAAEELQASHYPIATNGERHKHIRRAIKPAFALDTIAANARNVMDAIASRAATWTMGTRFVALDLARDLLGNIVIPALAGRALNEHLDHAIRFARFSVGAGLGAYPLAFRHAPHYRSSRTKMLAYFRDLVDWHRTHPPGDARNADFFDYVLGVRDENGDALPDGDIVAIAQMIYSNTLLYVAPAMTFLLHCLLADPVARSRCIEEIDAAFSDGTPDLERLRACAYFEAAKTESMRLHPIGLATPRVAKRSFEFQGYTLPAGEPLLIAVTVAHYLPEIYPDPLRFDPERHLAPRLESRAPGVYLPLGVGIHSCLAARMIDAMLLLTVGALLRHVEFAHDKPNHVLRKRVNPFSEPRDDFVIRLAGRRHGPIHASSNAT